jgi:hypothetical protein
MTGFQSNLFLTCLIFWILIPNTRSQEQLFKFKVSKEEIYHLTTNQVQSL